MERLYIGDWQDARDASAPGLVKVTVAKESPFVGDYYYPLIDAEDQSNESLLGDAIQKVAELHDDDRTVVVHCVSGISRSCAVVIGYLMMRGMTYNASYDLVRKARPAMNPEQDLVRLLKLEKARLGVDSRAQS